MQVVATACVPLIGVNLHRMHKKVRPLQTLRDELELAAQPGAILEAENG